jgi:hypothetical protein
MCDWIYILQCIDRYSLVLFYSVLYKYTMIGAIDIHMYLLYARNNIYTKSWQLHKAAIIGEIRGDL